MTQGTELGRGHAQGGGRAGTAPGTESGRSEAERKEARIFGFLLLPRFSLLAFTSAVEPMRSANRLAGQRLYDWRLISRNGGPVASSGGIEVMTQAAISDIDRIPDLFVVAGLDAQTFDDRAILAWLRRLERVGCRLGALTTGSYIFARAGLLDGYRCTIHWENLAGFREDFPGIDATLAEVYEIDRNRMTCSGGTAAMDLMLGLIAADHGRALATAVADQFIHERIRASQRAATHGIAKSARHHPTQAARGDRTDGG